MTFNSSIVDKVSDTLIRASSTMTEDHRLALEKAIAAETNENARWSMELILQNAGIAADQLSPLCDDTGIPHLLLDIGEKQSVTGDLIDSIYEGIAKGLELLPGRSMAVKGNDLERLDQSAGLEDNPAAVEPAPLLVRRIKEDALKLHILMFGGGPAIRGMTYRVFHQHSVETVVDEIVSRATEGSSLLGCTPVTLAIGIGRSQYEASSLMLQSLVDGSFSIQNDLEREITDRVNAGQTGVLGLGGQTTVLATFLKIGPQRASGVRVVSIRPCCLYEPRLASIDLQG